MESATSDEIAFEFPSIFRAYKDGRCERFMGTDHVSPGQDAATRTFSKDVTIAPGVSVRLFKPDNISVGKRLPVLVYYHGGGWCFGSAFCATYHDYMNDVVAKGKVIGVSVEYRLAPEYPLPIGYEDSWEALKWVASHSNGQGPEAWLNDHADLQRVFVAGDSSGGNIAHNVALQAGLEHLSGTNLVGACLVHPSFVNKEGEFHLIWKFACPTTTGFDDPRINPSTDSRLSNLGCSKILVCMAEGDIAKSFTGGLLYYETIQKSGWDGTAELVVSPEEHVFHLFNPTCENAVALMEKMVSFFDQE